jgi:hypothetical protein
MFSKKVDLRSRKAMIDFLRNHFRYDTMSSWNKMTSYANNVKLWNLGLTSEQMDAAFELLETDFWEEIWDVVEAFEARQGHEYAIRTNGRSGGYLVLYRSYIKTLDYRSVCTCCGQRNYKRVQEDCPQDMNPAMWNALKGLYPGWTVKVYLERPEVEALDIEPSEKEQMIQLYKRIADNATFDRKCGRCGSNARVNYDTPPSTVEVQPSGIDDDGDDFEEWSIEDLRERVRVVMDFDKTCDDLRESFVSMLEDYEVSEETIMVPQTVKVLQPRA